MLKTSGLATLLSGRGELQRARSDEHAQSAIVAVISAENKLKPARMPYRLKHGRITETV
jgi:hypothetical protein